jgi:hypothetical protein
LKTKALRILIVVIILSTLLSTATHASQTSSAYIAITNAYITRSGDDVNVYFYIVGRDIYMDKIGATEIRIFEQNGTTWSRVKTFDSNDSQYTSAMIDTNSGVLSSHVTYTEGSASKNYYAIVYFYAEKDGGSDTYNHDTPVSYGTTP